jgi:hypothetical protein
MRKFGRRYSLKHQALGRERYKCRMAGKSLLNSSLVAMILVLGCEMDLNMCYQLDGINKLAR